MRIYTLMVARFYARTSINLAVFLGCVHTKRKQTLPSFQWCCSHQAELNIKVKILLFRVRARFCLVWTDPKLHIRLWQRGALHLPKTFIVFKSYQIYLIWRFWYICFLNFIRMKCTDCVVSEKKCNGCTLNRINSLKETPELVIQLFTWMPRRRVMLIYKFMNYQAGQFLRKWRHLIRFA